MVLMDAAIVNKTRGVTLHSNPEWALTTAQQAKGFMFRRPRDACIIFLFLPQRRVGLHMWFVWGAIDVLALDGTGKVLALKKRFLPFAFWYPGVDASAVVELPAGTIERTRTALGDTVVLPKQVAKR
jgi:uncharacterized protein